MHFQLKLSGSNSWDWFFVYWIGGRAASRSWWQFYFLLTFNCMIQISAAMIYQLRLALFESMHYYNNYTFKRQKSKKLDYKY